MERIYILAPALVPAAYMILAFLLYCGLCAAGRPPRVDGADRRKTTDFFGPFWLRYFLWIIGPAERALLSGRVSPNMLTLSSLILCLASGIAIATGHLASAGWLYIFAGTCDILDGRIARATNASTKSGGFLDSVTDRWGELFVFAGFAWFLRDEPWLLAVMFAVAGSMMVSYTRARGEGLGLSLDGGMMQRAERIALVSIGTLVTAWFGTGSTTAELSVHVIGVALTLTGLGSSATAVSRFVRGYRTLRRQELAEEAGEVTVLPERVADAGASGVRPAAAAARPRARRVLSSTRP